MTIKTDLARNSGMDVLTYASNMLGLPMETTNFILATQTFNDMKLNGTVTVTTIKLSNCQIIREST